MYNWRGCLEQTEDQGTWNITRYVMCFVVALDAFWRKRDFAINRGYGGPAKRLLGIDGHSIHAFYVPAVLLAFVVFGPTPGWRGWAPVGVLAIAVAALYVGMRLVGNRRVLWFQLALMITVCAAVWIWAGESAREARDEAVPSSAPAAGRDGVDHRRVDRQGLGKLFSLEGFRRSTGVSSGTS